MEVHLQFPLQEGLLHLLAVNGFREEVGSTGSTNIHSLQLCIQWAWNSSGRKSKDLKTPERITSIEMVILGGFWRIFLGWELDSYRCKEERSPSMESVKPEGVLLQKQATWLACQVLLENEILEVSRICHTNVGTFHSWQPKRASAKVLDDYCCMRTLSRFPKLQSVAWQPWWSVPSGWLKLPR